MEPIIKIEIPILPVYKILFVITVFFLLASSCNLPAGQVTEISVDSVKHTISLLRQLGFFEKYHSLSDEALFDTMHQQRIKAYSEMFGKYYDPGMALENYIILALDRDRAIAGDYEASVGKGNQQYVKLLETFSAASGGCFNPENIIEEWGTINGPVKVSFMEHGEKVQFEPEYHDDWLAEKAFDVINQRMRKNGSEQFYLYLGKDSLGIGQYFLYVRMSEVQRQKVQKDLGWMFR